ncbi:hypothetical protein [Brucella anthropi]|uniref:hypothetical protein n=1 Tax=Brucella anthropi TaxID=529 RepID=UPI001559683D|nr:hypothetical protein [Brucella anthropi]
MKDLIEDALSFIAVSPSSQRLQYGPGIWPRKCEAQYGAHDNGKMPVLQKAVRGPHSRRKSWMGQVLLKIMQGTQTVPADRGVWPTLCGFGTNSSSDGEG